MNKETELTYMLDIAEAPAREVGYSDEYNPFFTDWKIFDAKTIAKMARKCKCGFLFPSDKIEYSVLVLACRKANKFIRGLEKQKARGVCIEPVYVYDNENKLTDESKYITSLYTTLGKRPIAIEDFTEELEKQYNDIIYKHTKTNGYFLAIFNICEEDIIEVEEDVIIDFVNFKGIKKIYFFKHLFEMKEAKGIEE